MKNKVILSNEACLKMKYFVEKAPGEISGMCKSKILEDGDIYVEDCIIFEQVSSSAHTEISEAAMAVFLTELVRAGDSPANWNIWWHSHATMDVFWSGTDTKTIEDHTNQAYLISIVTNKKGKYKARLDIFPTDHSPFAKETLCTYDNLPVEEEESSDDEFKEQKTKLIDIISEARSKLKEISELKNAEIKAWCDAEVAEKLKAPAPVVYNQGQRNLGMYGNDYGDGEWGERGWRSWGKKNINSQEKSEELQKEIDEDRLNREMGFDDGDDWDDYPDDNPADYYYNEEGKLVRNRQAKLLAGMY